MEKTSMGEITAQTTQNVQSIDFTEFVKQLGRDYGMMVYESECIETPEDLQSTIDYADVNFCESDSLNWMLNWNSEYESIAKVFEDMEWEEYCNYEEIFVDAAKERMEECLQDWKCNLADDLVSEYESKIATETNELFESVKCFGIESYDQIDQIDDLEIKQYVLERTGDALYNVQWLVNDMYDKIGDLYDCESIGPDDGFTVQLPIMRFFGFNHSEYDGDNMSYCMDYIVDKHIEVSEMLDDVNYQIRNLVTVTC